MWRVFAWGGHRAAGVNGQEGLEDPPGERESGMGVHRTDDDLSIHPGERSRWKRRATLTGHEGRLPLRADASAQPLDGAEILVRRGLAEWRVLE
jgi:hypothetical protein